MDFNEILEKTTGLLSKYPSFSGDKSKQIRIVKDFDPHLPLVETDPMQQQQIFLNLFLNAADAMPDGGVLTVRTITLAAGDFIEISVSDTGEGVDEATARKIFIPFFTTKTKGTGLGLPTSKRLVEQNGGAINFQSTPGKGTVIKILFPVKQNPPLVNSIA
jgi:signal transduction histidine kinase